MFGVYNDISSSVSNSLWVNGATAVLVFTGYVSERHDAHGSFFIRALVEAFYKHSCHRDMKRLFEEQVLPNNSYNSVHNSHSFFTSY